jgi:hypothetical protein
MPQITMKIKAHTVQQSLFSSYIAIISVQNVNNIVNHLLSAIGNNDLALKFRILQSFSGNDCSTLAAEKDFPSSASTPEERVVSFQADSSF